MAITAAKIGAAEINFQFPLIILGNFKSNYPILRILRKKRRKEVMKEYPIPLIELNEAIEKGRFESLR